MALPPKVGEADLFVAGGRQPEVWSRIANLDFWHVRFSYSDYRAVRMPAWPLHHSKNAMSANADTV